MKTIGVLLFENFTLLDAFGPIEVLARLGGGIEIHYVSKSGGLISGTGNAKVATEPTQGKDAFDLFLVPGGLGTRRLVEEEPILEYIRTQSERATHVLSVCTGSALLAKAGVLNRRRATSNKRAWDWVVQQGPEVEWIRKARWVVDGKFFTSAGVAAGIDMALGFVADQVGAATAESLAHTVEYVWNSDKTSDPF